MLEQTAFDLRTPWRTLARRWQWLAFLAVLGIVLGAGLSGPAPAKSTATQRLAVGALPGETVTGALEAELIRDADAFEAVKTRLGRYPDRLRVAPLQVGAFLDLEVQAATAARATETLKAYATVYVERRGAELAGRQRARVEVMKDAIARTTARRREVDELLNAELEPTARGTLQRERDTVEAQLVTEKLALAELEAVDPERRAGRLVGSGPVLELEGGGNPRLRNAVVGLIAGLMVAGAAALVVEKAGDRVRGARDVTRVSPDLPVLAALARDDGGRSGPTLWSLVSARLPRGGGAVVVAPARPSTAGVDIAETLARAGSAAGDVVELVPAKKLLRGPVPDLPEYAVIDAPPLLSRAAALDVVRALEPGRGSVLLLLQAGRTSHGEQRRAVELLALSGVPVLGAVLVGVERVEAFPLMPPRRWPRRRRAGPS